VKDRFADWVALGSVDVDDFIAANFKDPDNWERNFRAAKAKSQVTKMFYLNTTPSGRAV
jgi:hypothetical protein